MEAYIIEATAQSKAISKKVLNYEYQTEYHTMTCKDPEPLDDELRGILKYLNSLLEKERKNGKKLEDKDNVMVGTKYEKEYAEIVESSKYYTDLVPFMKFARDIADLVLNEGEENLLYIQKVQDDLYSKGIIPFKVSNVRDISKIESLPYSKVSLLLHYIWLSFRNCDREYLKLGKLDFDM